MVDRKNYSNIAEDTTLVSGITAGALSLEVVDAAGWPAAPFCLVIEVGTASEEIVLVGAKAGNIFSSLTRGYNGTVAVTHSSLVTIKHIAVADDYRGIWEHIHNGVNANQQSHDDLANVSTDDHHNKLHIHDGVDGSGTVLHSDTTGKTANDHHNQAHAINGADHTAAGLTAGHVLKALTATTFGFAQLDHDLLAGLADDDHPQYSKVDGTRAFTGVVGGVTPTLAAHLTRKDYVDALIAAAVSAAVPVGSVMLIGYNVADAGFLLLDGTSYLRANYTALWAKCGSTGSGFLGNGDGSTTFVAPDARQKFFLVKATAGTGSTLGGTGGTIDHVHSVPIHGHANTIAFTDHAVHLHSVPIHGHANTIAVYNHDEHTHAFTDSFTTSGHTLAATDTTTNPSGSRVNQSGGHTGSVTGNTGGVNEGILWHQMAGAVTDKAAFNTENAAAMAHSKTGAVTDAAAFNTTSGNPPFITVNAQIKV